MELHLSIGTFFPLESVVLLLHIAYIHAYSGALLEFMKHKTHEL